MKRKIIQSVLFILLGIGIFQSCDKIESPYRKANNDTTVISILDSNAIVVGNDTFQFPADATPNIKKVLAEDYTGHLCGNCPAAGILLNDTIKPIFSDHLVVISVHAGFFATFCPNGAACPGTQPAGAFTADYNTTAGTAWNTFFGIVGNPKGMIDRIDFPTSQHSKSPSSWASLIQAECLLSPDFKIRILNHYNSATGELKTAVHSKFLANKTGDYKIQVVLTEDSIIDWQEWYSHTPLFVPDYIHHHVLRDAITNGSFGAPLDSGSVAAGTTILKGYDHQVNSNWNAAHCKVVVFIYDDANKKILQAEEADIIQ